MTKRGRIVLIGALALVAIPLTSYIGTMAFLFLAPEVEAYRKATQFESAAWKARSMDADHMWPTRLRMADDLLQSGKLTGATRQQVEDLLGPPDKTEYFKDWTMVYWLGPERGAFRIDSEWLGVRLDERGIVSEARLLRD
jgi:hypothetical protein